MKPNEPCIDYTQIITVILVSFALLTAYYKYIDYQVTMLAKRPEKKNKITVRVLAAGFAAAYAIMLTPAAKETLNFQIYSIEIEAYNILKAIIFLCAMAFVVLTGGLWATNIKGTDNNGGN